jgi:hypothetical protein
MHEKPVALVPACLPVSLVVVGELEASPVVELEAHKAQRLPGPLGTDLRIEAHVRGDA